MNLGEKIKSNVNNINLPNYYLMLGDTSNTETQNKKSFQRYKYHMLHHNNVLNQIKSTGIDMNLMENVLNSNDDLIIRLLKNNNENSVRQNITNALAEMIKNNSKTNENNSINIIQSYYENFAKKYKINFKNEKNLLSTETKFKKLRPKLSTLSYTNIENKKGIEDKPNKEKKRRRHSLNDFNKNSFTFQMKLDDFTKNKYFPNNKGRLSIDLSSNKNKNDLLLIDGKDNKNASLPFILQNLNDKAKNLYKRLSAPILINSPKRSNSNINLNGDLNNVFIFNNKKSIFKDIFTNVKNNNNIVYIRNNKSPNITKKNKSPFNKGIHLKGNISFKKMLSRDYINKIKSIKVEDVLSLGNPNYNFVEPKCIMKVAYTKNHHPLQNQNFKGLGAEAFIDMDKLYSKYNNHSLPKSIYFKKMAGRGNSSDTKLPIFMINQIDRNSCNTFNEKNLKMNYYSNGQLKQLISCLNDKKSFNYKLNERLKEESEEKKNFNILAKQIFEKGIINNNDSKLINEDNDNIENRQVCSIPFRVNSLFKSFMSEYNRKISFPEKIDGVTFKNFKIDKNNIRVKKILND